MRCLHPWNVARLFYGQFSLPLCFVGSWISFGGIFIFNWFTRGFRFRGSARVDRGNKLRNVFNFRKMLVLLSGNSIDRALYIFLCVIFVSNSLERCLFYSNVTLYEVCLTKIKFQCSWIIAQLWKYCISAFLIYKNRNTHERNTISREIIRKSHLTRQLIVQI